VPKQEKASPSYLSPERLAAAARRTGRQRTGRRRAERFAWATGFAAARRRRHSI